MFYYVTLLVLLTTNLSPCISSRMVYITDYALSFHIPIYQTFSNELNTLDHFLASASSSSTPTPNISKIVTRGRLYIEIVYSTIPLQQNLYLNVYNKTVRHFVILPTYSSLHSLLIYHLSLI